MAVCFWFFWIRSVQFGSNLIKLDQIGFPHQSKNVTIKSCHICRKDKNDCLIFDFFGSELSKMDQTWSNWISRQSKNFTIKSCHIYHEDENSYLIFLDQICPKWIKLDQIGFLTNQKMLLKSVHFKNTVIRSSFHSKLWPFSLIHQLTLFWCQLMYYWKWS